ncbi:hypothetical protein D3C71_501560 [compost metagenome]
MLFLSYLIRKQRQALTLSSYWFVRKLFASQNQIQKKGLTDYREAFLKTICVYYFSTITVPD